MGLIGTVESLWRYPVKSMRGEELEELFAGFSGVQGDRRFAFKSSASPADFPYSPHAINTRCCGIDPEAAILTSPPRRMPQT